MSAPKRTVLYPLHAELGARFVPFAGYEMPVQYADGLKTEHLWTRAHAGFFDVSHMGQVRVRGQGLHAALERALPVDFSGWPVGVQRYSLLLNDAGGIDDDLMVVNLGDEVLIVVNAAGRERDVARLRALCPGRSVELLDTALVALQGPSAEAVLASLDPAVAALRFMHVGRFTLEGATCVVSRSGYTGEDGFEISVPAAGAERLARRLLAHPEVRPIGLGARDTLRLEAGLPLYGQDMDETTTPVEAGLAWAIAKSRRAGGSKAGGFPGAAMIFDEAEARRPRKFGAFIGGEPVPVRHGAAIVGADGTAVGEVTSGTVSPCLNRPIMMGYIDAGVPDDAPLFALVRGQPRPIERATPPFVPKRYKR